MYKRLISTMIALAAVIQVHAVAAQEFLANIGWNSEYIYRGIPQKTSSAFAGLVERLQN